MDRRTVLASLAGGTALVTGVSVHRRLSSEPESRKTPEIPNPLTAESVTEFVTDYVGTTGAVSDEVVQRYIEQTEH